MGQTQFDVVIVGAGMAGASVAAELAAERRVLLLEKETLPGTHATGRSAASYIPSYRAHDKALRALTLASRSFLDAPPVGFSSHPLLRQRGLLTLLGQHPAIVADVERLALNSVLQSPIEILPADEVLCRLPALSKHWQGPAWWEPDVHDMDVNALHQGYLRLLQQRGGQLATSKNATADYSGGKWCITADHISVSANIIVNAAGAWADDFAEGCGVSRLGLIPKRRTAILVSPPAGHDVSDWPLVLAHDESFYFKPDAGMLLVSPVDEHPSVPCDAQPDELDIAYAADFAQQALDGMAVKTIPHSWAGLRTFAPDATPVIGFDETAPGFFWCAGQGGHGIQIAPAVAQLSASLIQRNQAISSINSVPFDPQWVSPARFKTINNITMAMPH